MHNCMIPNTKQIQNQNSIKHNTRTPGKCIKCIMCIISRPAGIPVLAVTYKIQRYVTMASSAPGPAIEDEDTLLQEFKSSPLDEL